MTNNFEQLVDVLLRVSAWILFLWLETNVPVIRHIDEDELWYYRYPSMDSYVPKVALYTFVAVVPSTILLFQYIIQRKNENIGNNIWNHFMGLSLAYCMNGITTSMLKLAVGRPRPNFFLRCFPDGYGTNIEDCTGEYHGQMDGRKSFPSGHASFAFTGMTYMALHLVKVLELEKPRSFRGPLLFCIFLLLLVASMISASRTADYHHHYSDVVGGCIIGAAIAYGVYSFYAVPAVGIKED